MSVDTGRQHGPRAVNTACKHGRHFKFPCSQAVLTGREQDSALCGPSLMRGFMCNYCMQRAATPACNNCRPSNVFENIHEAIVLQPMTAFGGIT